MTFKLPVAMLFTCLVQAAPAAEPRADEWAGLEGTMSPREFRASGLDKLSPEELTALNLWLEDFLGDEPRQAISTDETEAAGGEAEITTVEVASSVKSAPEPRREPETLRIVGHFSGWDGETEFRLNNGEVWKQRIESTYSESLENPEVELQRNFFGFYEMRVVATGRRVGVSRVE